jgi:ribonuclease HII
MMTIITLSIILKKNRDMFIRYIAEDYADWMATCHDAYVGHNHSYDFAKKMFMKDG